MSLGLADKRLFVINNGRVVEDGETPAGCLGEVANPCTVSEDNVGFYVHWRITLFCSIPTLQRYYHQGAVLELVPGQTPVMKPDDYVDAGVCVLISCY